MCFSVVSELVQIVTSTGLAATDLNFSKDFSMNILKRTWKSEWTINGD